MRLAGAADWDVAYVYLYRTQLSPAQVAGRAALGAACPEGDAGVEAVWRFEGPQAKGSGPDTRILSVEGGHLYVASEALRCGMSVCVCACCLGPTPRAVFKNPNYYGQPLTTAPKDRRQPPTANRQKPTATNRQPPTATNRIVQYCFCGFASAHVLTMKQRAPP